MQIRQLSGCGCSTVQGLGELTDTEAARIAADYFNTMPIDAKLALGAAIAGGNFSALGEHARIIATKICSAGAKDKLLSYLPLGLLMSVVGVGTIMIIKKTKKK